MCTKLLLEAGILTLNHIEVPLELHDLFDKANG